MQSTVEHYARFLPDHLIRRHGRDPTPPGNAGLEAYRGAVLMADVIGYTALTRRYSERAQGVEELTGLLNEFFGRLNAIIFAHGGDIISFAGDSVFAVWHGEAAGETHAAARAAQCGLAAQRALDPAASGAQSELRMRIVVAAGELSLATVGGVSGKWECLAMGAPINRIGAGLAQADPGAVVIDPRAWEAVAAGAQASALGEGYARLVALADAPATPPAARVVPDARAAAALRCFIAKPVLEQLDAGHADWLAEFRRASTAFVSIKGIAYDSSDAIDRLQAATHAVQSAVERYEGTFHRVIVDDKGTNMLCVWGIPGRAHEDDAVRAVLSGAAIADAIRGLGHDCGVGIATGRVLCGPSGGGGRYEYTVTGDTVNVAARLMVAAGSGVLCHAATAEAATGALEFDALPPIQVKGREAPLPVARPRAARTREKTHAARTASPRLLGRGAEIARLQAQLDRLAAGEGGVVAIEGEPGVGKSRLTAQFALEVRERGIECLIGHADAIERNTTYFVWRPILRQVLRREAAEDPAAQRRCIEAWCASAPRLSEWLPLLNDALQLGYRESALTRQMSELARAESTRELLVHMLASATGDRPAVVVLEDAHWMDSMSWSLAEQLRQRIGPRLMIMLVTRSGQVPDHEDARRLLALAAPATLSLTTFSREDTAALVCDRLRVSEMPEEVVDLIFEKSDGHPLYSEELAYALRDAGHLRIEAGRCELPRGRHTLAALDLPVTIEGIITSRIDRLGAAEQLTLKVASVFGRGFALAMLGEIHPMRLDPAAIAAQFDTFTALDLIHRLPTAAADFQFKHILTQEAAYRMLAFAQRSQLHRAAAGWYERTHAADLSVAYPLLAHHWSRAGDPPRAVHFLHKAGEQAFTRYANREAVAFLAEALTIRLPTLDAVQRAHCQRLLGFALLWLGDLQRSRAHLEKSLALLGQPIPSSLGALILGTGSQLAQAVVNHFLGRRFLRRAGADEARGRYLAETLLRYAHIAYFLSDTPRMLYSALRCLNYAERSPNSGEIAVIYAAMAGAAAGIPAHGLARRYCALALRIAEEVDDPAVTAQVLLFNTLYEAGVGTWAESMRRVATSRALSEAGGNLRRAEECMVITGFLHLHTGDFASALRSFEEAAASGRKRGDGQTWGWGILGIGRVRLVQGRTQEAIRAFGEAAPLIIDRLGGVELHGMEALAAMRLGDHARALDRARTGLQMLREARSPSLTALNGTAGIAESLLALWLRAKDGDPALDAAALKRLARAGLKALNRFASIYPIGRPLSLYMQGCAEYASSRPERACTAWHKAAAAAAGLGMPYEEARAAFALALHAAPVERGPAQARAMALAQKLGIGEPPMLIAA